MSIQVERPKTVPAIRALIRKRDRQIFALEQVLQTKGLPAHTRRYMQQNLKASRANRQSWIDYLEKKAA